jgi:branched-chain amino acid transport system permease protein
MKPNTRIPLAIAVLLIVLVIPFATSGSLVRLITTIFMYGIMASALNIIAGYTGYAAFGNMIFFGLGAYTVAVMMAKAHLPFGLAFVCACVIVVCTAILLGLLLLRLKGHYFALGSLGATEAVRQIVDIWTDLTGGSQGISIPFLPGSPFFANAFFYFLMFIIMVATVFFVSRLHRNRLGYALKAIRADEDAANVMGINTTKYKIIAWCLSALFTSMAGAVYAYQTSYIDPPTVFNVVIVVQLFMMILVGGMGTVMGPVVGALLLGGFSEFFRTKFLYIHQGMLGLMIILAVLFMPNGILKLNWKGLVGLFTKGGRE